MWCRLVSGEAADKARTIAWRDAGTTPGPPPPGIPAPAQPRLYAANTEVAEKPEPDTSLEQHERRAAEAYQRGLKEGEAAATQRLTAQVNAKLEQLGNSIEQLAAHRGRIQREAEPELVRLALVIARRVLRRELSVDPESLRGLLKVGLEKIESAELYRIRVHPEHVGILKNMLQGSSRPVEVAPDPALTPGGVIFETSRGSIDTSMETQLREIERGFADLYPR